MTLRLAAWIGAAALLCSCRDQAAPAPRESLPVGSEVVARVGDTDITVDTVEGIVAAQRLAPARAREIAVRDALFASEARARGLGGAETVQAATSAVLARAVLRQLLDEAERAGPVTDDELRVATERHWLDLDRPEGYRTVHAVVRLQADANAATRAKAATVADAIRVAVAPARDVALREPPPQALPGRPPPTDPAANAFERAARGVSPQGLEVVVQPLPPVASTGRVLAPEPQQFDVDYARAAASLVARGDQSAVVTTSFGVHVIMLLERIPAQVVPVNERRRLVRDEVVSDRARAAQAKLLDVLRREPRVVGTVDALMELVRIEP